MAVRIPDTVTFSDRALKGGLEKAIVHNAFFEL